MGPFSGLQIGSLGRKHSVWLMPSELRRLQGRPILLAPILAAASRQQGRPGRIRREARGRRALLVAAGDVDREQPGPGTPARIAKKHDDPAVRAPGRTLVVEALGQQPLARPVRLHDTDRELAGILLGERNVVAARRPDRGRIDSLAEADALGGAAAGAHYIDLRMAAAVGLKADTRAVGRIAGRGV